MRTWTTYDRANTHAHVANHGALRNRYLYGLAADESWAWKSSAGVTGWYLTDRPASVRKIANTSGAVMDHLTYHAHGQVVSESNPAAGTCRDQPGPLRIPTGRRPANRQVHRHCVDPRNPLGRMKILSRSDRSSRAPPKQPNRPHSLSKSTGPALSTSLSNPPGPGSASTYPGNPIARFGVDGIETERLSSEA